VCVPESADCSVTDCDLPLLLRNLRLEELIGCCQLRNCILPLRKPVFLLLQPRFQLFLSPVRLVDGLCLLSDCFLVLGGFAIQTFFLGLQPSKLAVLGISFPLLVVEHLLDIPVGRFQFLNSAVPVCNLLEVVVQLLFKLCSCGGHFFNGAILGCNRLHLSSDLLHQLRLRVCQIGDCGIGCS